jgi:hypothetical protein
MVLLNSEEWTVDRPAQPGDQISFRDITLPDDDSKANVLPSAVANPSMGNSDNSGDNARSILGHQDDGAEEVRGQIPEQQESQSRAQDDQIPNHSPATSNSQVALPAAAPVELSAKTENSTFKGHVRGR